MCSNTAPTAYDTALVGRGHAHTNVAVVRTKGMEAEKKGNNGTAPAHVRMLLLLLLLPTTHM